MRITYDHGCWRPKLLLMGWGCVARPGRIFFTCCNHAQHAFLSSLCLRHRHAPLSPRRILFFELKAGALDGEYTDRCTGFEVSRMTQSLLPFFHFG